MRKFKVQHHWETHWFHEPVKGDHISKSHERGHFYESTLLQAIARLELDGTYLDVGAHIGNHSVFFAKHCAARRVFAYEAQHGPVAQALRANVADSCVRVVQPVFVGDGGLVAPWDDRPNMDGNTGMRAWHTPPVGSPVVGIQRTQTLDALLEHQTVPGGVVLIKVDVEGLEPAVLRGAAATINRYHPVLIVESGSPKGIDRHDLIRDTLNTVCPGYTHGAAFGATPTYIWKHKAKGVRL